MVYQCNYESEDLIMSKEQKVNKLTNEIEKNEAEREILLRKLREYIYEYQENEMNYLNEVIDLISKINRLNNIIETNSTLLKTLYN